MSESPITADSRDRNEYLRPEDAAILLGCSTRTIRKMVASGELPAPARLGRLTRWRADDPRAWMAERESPRATSAVEVQP
ncbi:MAG: helix-turn-helix domain-containing protein [Polyangiaceae bacterium]|nr:helix-turn-helix domain-containing protein [Polyangiaceae bacterium]